MYSVAFITKFRRESSFLDGVPWNPLGTDGWEIAAYLGHLSVKQIAACLGHLSVKQIYLCELILPQFSSIQFKTQLKHKVIIIKVDIRMPQTALFGDFSLDSRSWTISRGQNLQKGSQTALCRK